MFRIRQAGPLAAARATGSALLASGVFFLACAPAAAQTRNIGQDARIQPPEPQTATPLPPPPPPAPPPARDPQRIVLGQLRGLVFVSLPAQLVAKGKAASGIDVAAVPFLDDPAFKDSLAPYMGKPLRFSDLEAIKALTVAWFREHDRPLVNVVVPPQEVVDGTVQILAVQFRLQKVTVRNAKHFRNERLARQVRAKVGDFSSQSIVLDDLAWLSSNPFREATASYEAGDTVGETQLNYNVNDRKPFTWNVGYRNNGTATTDRSRLSAGFTWGDAFGLDQQLSYQLTASPDFRKLAAHSVVYRAPLPWRGFLTLSGSYATVVPVLENSFGARAKSYQISGRYEHWLPTVKGWSNRLVAGFDFKRSNSNLTFGGLSILTGTTDIAQLVLGFETKSQDPLGQTTAGIFVTHSPGRFTHFNTDAAFQPAFTHAGRAFASANYTYGTFHFERLTALRGFEMMTRVEGQWTQSNLLSSEQFGLGGMASVRGYDERAVNTDRGLFASNELRTPGIGVLRKLGIADLPDRLRFVGFWDYGIGSLSRPDLGERKSYSLMSLGLGVRYSAGPLQIAADWAAPLRKVLPTDRSRFHVAAGLSF